MKGWLLNAFSMYWLEIFNKKKNLTVLRISSSEVPFVNLLEIFNLKCLSQWNPMKPLDYNAILIYSLEFFSTKQHSIHSLEIIDFELILFFKSFHFLCNILFSVFLVGKASAPPLTNVDDLINSVETFIFDCDGKFQFIIFPQIDLWKTVYLAEQMA